MKESVSIANETGFKLPRFCMPAGRQDLLGLKTDILGKSYSLSVAIVGEKKSRELNKKYRKKDRPTNVLSFALSTDAGELVLCPAVIKKEARGFEKTFEEFFGFLVIHGMLHLKGLDHSSTMEKAEAKYDKKYFGGNRRGIDQDPGRGRRVSKRRKKS